MNKYLKSLKLLFTIIVGLMLVLGCTTDKDETKTDSPSQNEETNNESNTQNEETSYFDKVEIVNVYAERQLEIEIKPPFKNFYLSWNEKPQHYISANRSTYIYSPNVKYFPEWGYIGNDNFSLKVEDKDTKKVYIKKFIININKSPLKGNRDFTIISNCERKSSHFGESVNSMDIDIVDDTLNTLVPVRDDIDIRYISNFSQEPAKSRIEVDYFNDDNSFENSQVFHNIFKNNLENNVLLTCNYNKGYADLFFPIKDKIEWDAIASGRNSSYIKFQNNNLYFYVSSLSDLHSKIYLKEYKKTYDSAYSFEQASNFMEKVFPNSHYTAELGKKYGIEDIETESLKELKFKFDEDNSHYYSMLSYLAEEYTNNSISKLIRMIVANYESYYLSDEQECLDTVICGTFFSEYTKSLTTNSNFSDALTGWSKNNNIDEVYSSGKIEYISPKKYVEVDFVANVPKESGRTIASLDLYQTSTINSNSLTDYFFFFDLADVYGGAGGHPGLAGVDNSGIVGAYTCFQDKNKNNLGCLTWSDHLNKKQFIPSYTSEGIKFLHRLLPTDTLYNTELRDVFRRTSNRSLEQRFTYTGNLAKILEQYLPLLYENKEKIDFVEYGIFASEFRNGSDSCYNCEGKVKAYELKLLKVKKAMVSDPK